MTKIQWTDETDNPIYLLRQDGGHGGHWCRKKSEGCNECYAETMNRSGFFSFASHLPYTGEPPQNLHFDESIVQRWARVRSPKKRFVCSMTDLFGEWVTLDWQFKVLDAAARAPSQTIQLLTKRPDVMLRAVEQYLAAGQSIGQNVWFGITVENQRCATERLPWARAIAALGCIVWVSHEPALGAVSFTPWFPSIRWIVMGGTFGKEPCCIDWFQQIIQERDRWDQHQTRSRVALFVKQLGSHPYSTDPDQFLDANLLLDGDHWWLKTGDRHNGDIEKFPQCLQVREFPACSV